MRWFSAGFVGVLCAALGGLLAAWFGEMATRAHGVSNFEGGRGYLVVFLIIPAGLVAGLVIGILAGAGLGRNGGMDFFKALGTGLLATAAVGGAAGGLALLSAPRVPTLGGRTLTLEFEIRLPAGKTLPDSLQEAGFTASMYSTSKDNRFATVDFEQVGLREGRLTIPGHADLLTEVGGRTVLAGLNFEESQVFHLPLAGKPAAADEAWSDWVRADQYTRLEPKLLPADAWEIRYRVLRDEAPAGR